MSDADDQAASRPLLGRWIGGANLPTTWGSRVNAGFLLAELVVRPGHTVLRLRGPLARVARAEVLTVTPADVNVVFPIRSKVRFRGVGIQRHDGREYYFKTNDIDRILDVLECAGFPVSRLAKPASKIWRPAP